MLVREVEINIYFLYTGRWYYFSLSADDDAAAT